MAFHAWIVSSPAAQKPLVAVLSRKVCLVLWLCLEPAVSYKKGWYGFCLRLHIVGCRFARVFLFVSWSGRKGLTIIY